ncbi:hypothetical protein PC110_g14937 [Phytophthora cactorum]|uniref:Uncharacterized protein n=1 Tax=Phytophthora cactorum TaxID=29920 RepID=A0A329RWJ3_9STRA|nr:hypothetical protein PC110_g14937 [Phytophthora cactorum]
MLRTLPSTEQHGVALGFTVKELLDAATATTPFRTTPRVKLLELHYLVSNIVTSPIDETTKVATLMKSLKDGPVNTYLFREYPSTLVMQEVQVKLHVNVPKMARAVMRTGGPESMDLANATAAGQQQNNSSARCLRCGYTGNFARVCTTLCTRQAANVSMPGIATVKQTKTHEGSRRGPPYR